MSKNPRGLPGNFQLDVPSQLATPVKLDEFIDDELARARSAKTLKEQPPEAAPPPIPATPAAEAVATTTAPHVPARERVEPLAEALPRRVPRPARPVEPSPVPLVRPRFRQAGLPLSKPLRVQLNMSPAVNKMLGEIVEHFRTYCVQKDTTPSEIFEALVSALYDARGHLGLGNVPPRGQWGSASAQAFRIHVRNAITEAIVSQYEATREQIPQ